MGWHRSGTGRVGEIVDPHTPDIMPASEALL